jgi:hypothetical protein
MRVYRISVDYFPGAEGDHWQNADVATCPSCGLRSPEFNGPFPTPDDYVFRPSLNFDDGVIPPFFSIGGLYFTNETAREHLAGIYGDSLVFTPVPLECSHIQSAIYWLRTPGYLVVKPHRFHLDIPCSHCGLRPQKRISPSPQTNIYKVFRDSWHGTALYHAEEHGSPDFVDEPFKEVLEGLCNVFSGALVSFRETEITTD